MDRHVEYAALNFPLDSSVSQLEILEGKEKSDPETEQVAKKENNVRNCTIMVSLLTLVILSCTVGILVHQMHLKNENDGNTGEEEVKENCSFHALRDELCVGDTNATKDQKNECKLCPVDWKLFQENCYLISTRAQIKTWNDSQAFCLGMKAHLPVIENQEQKTYLGDIKGTYWSGMYFDNNLKTWTWANCESCKNFELNFKNTPEENKCVLISHSYYSEKCSSEQNWICQKKAIRL